ncbi:MAG TPA: GrpB family protein [Polyangiaceae bacterium LLY-WYZ-15_(1-7)]|nr:GrpB family protein [Polyangiaceae bacterium LLY-WYZ-15_(1-7)]
MAELFHLRDVPRAQLDAERDRVLARLRSALPPAANAREVGSTAIPTLPGKGDLDLLVRAPAPAFDATRAALDALFPRDPQQLSCADYQGYRVPSPLGLDIAIQLTVLDGRWDDFLPFLDALRTDPDLLARYAALKRAWDGRPMDAYREAKAAFIRAALAAQRARRSADQRPSRSRRSPQTGPSSAAST